MKLFTIDKNGKFIQFKEKDFKKENKEIDLEGFLENNPEYFFENSKILIIGRQVTTNLNTFIDLLGIDNQGNTVVIELKREKTSRETLAQLIEYASFVDNLDYDQLNEIYQNYTGEETNLEEYHKEYFDNSDDYSNVSWNKSSKLVIVAQEITQEIKQASLYLRRKGLDIYCMEFKYFINSEREKMISSDFIVGDETFIKQKVSSNAQLPKNDKETFMSNLDSNGKKVLKRIFEFSDKEKLLIRWGAKGFSLNVPNKSEFVGLCFCYPQNCPYNQSIITGFRQIEKKIGNSSDIISYYEDELNKLGLFNTKVGFFGKHELKWQIDAVSEQKIDSFINLLTKIANLVIERIKNNQTANTL